MIKVGTSLLTRDNLRLDYNTIADIIEQIAWLAQNDHEIILVSSGAIGSGREAGVKINEKNSVRLKQILASIGQIRLSQIYSEFFREKKIVVAQALLTREDFQRKISYTNIRYLFESMLKHKIIPIINENDMISDTESTFGDNDQLAGLTAALLEVDILIILSDIDGLYTSDPKLNKDSKQIKYVEKVTDDILKYSQNTFSMGGSGGMYSKLSAIRLATEHGIKAILCDGNYKDSIIKALNQNYNGTMFLPQKRKKLSISDKWIKTAAKINGSLIIDPGAIKALENNKSLLAVGIIKKKGNFKAGEVIAIQSETETRLGTGITKKSSAEIDAIILSNQKRGIIVVHKDYLHLLR